MKEEVYIVYSRSAFGFWFSYYTVSMKHYYTFKVKGCSQDEVTNRDKVKHQHTFF